MFSISLSLHKICFLIPLLPLKGHSIVLLQLKILRYSAPKRSDYSTVQTELFWLAQPSVPLFLNFQPQITSHEGRAINRNTVKYIKLENKINISRLINILNF